MKTKAQYILISLFSIIGITFPLIESACAANLSAGLNDIQNASDNKIQNSESKQHSLNIKQQSLDMKPAQNQSTKQSPILDRIVAVVNQDAIPESELNRQLQLLLTRLRQTDMSVPPLAQLKKQLLDKLILERLQLQMAKESKVEVTDETLNKALEDIAKRDNMTTAQMQKVLDDQGVGFEQFRKSIRTELIISQLQQREVASHISISNSEVEQFMKSPGGLDQSGMEYRLGHILIPLPETSSAEKIASAEKKAQEILKQLNAGSDFTQIAMTKSAGPQALNGGDLGFRRMQELPTLFAKVAGTLTKGQIMGPIRNESGFHIIKLLDKRDGNAVDPSLSKEEIKNRATDALFQRRFEEKLVTWLRRVRDDAEVQVFLNEN